MKVQYALWLASCVGEVLAHFWPITVGVGLALLVALVLTLHRQKPSWRMLWSAMPFAVAVIILAWGALFEYHSLGGPRWALNALYGFLAIELVLGILVTIRLRPYRWLAASAGAGGLWVSLCAAFVAGMSVYGTWL